MIAILDCKNKEWYEFISEEGENMYKSYKLKVMFYPFTRNIPQLFFCSLKGIDRFHCHAIQKLENHEVEKAREIATL